MIGVEGVVIGLKGVVREVVVVGLGVVVGLRVVVLMVVVGVGNVLNVGGLGVVVCFGGK